MMTHDEMIDVIRAHREGKQIQFSSPGNGWRNCLDDPSWNFQTNCYRVKPEPREIWVNVYDDNSYGSIHDTKERAIAYCNAGGTTIRFRAVIDEE